MTKKERTTKKIYSKVYELHSQSDNKKRAEKSADNRKKLGGYSVIVLENPKGSAFKYSVWRRNVRLDN